VARTELVTMTIAASAAVSNGFGLDGRKPVGIFKPATWTAADISFEVSTDGSTWVKVIDSAGALLKITGVSATVAEYYVVTEASDLIAAPHIRVVSTNTASEVDVNQDAARTLTLVCVPLP